MDAIMRESTFAQYIMKQGLEKGREEGIEKGIQESIQEVLDIRFGLSEAHPIAERISAIDDLQHLKQLHRSAVQVSNIKAFQQVLDEAD